jgi:hypothetical protein
MDIGAEASARTAAQIREPEASGPTAAQIRHGYLFWGPVILGILLVELAGAASHWLKENILHFTIPWTTISGMVGHLEDIWPVSAVFVIAIMAPAVFYALAPRDAPAPAPGGHRSETGRLYLRTPPGEPLSWYTAWVVFILSAIVGTIAVLVFDDNFVRAYFIYGALFAFGIVFPSVLVLLGHREVPFTSLFVTARALRQQRNWIAWLATVAISAGLGILLIHLAFYPWPDITKAPVRYAGLTAREARSKAVRSVKHLQQGPAALVYSTQARGVVNGREAWAVFFTNGSDSSCVVTATDKLIDPSDCAP